MITARPHYDLKGGGAARGSKKLVAILCK